MKLKNFLERGLGVVLMSLIIASAAHAEKTGNGGDMCEDRFKIIRDDIASWITSGGSAQLTLPEGLSPNDYATQMRTQILGAQISCTDSVITIGQSEKTCKNLQDSSGVSRILCNTKRFLQTPDTDQYILVHHEYAGLSGYEINNGESSDYSISNQISEYLENQIVKKLAIKKPVITNALGQNFVVVQPGTFIMGSPASEGFSDETQHQVTLTRTYEIQTTDVTQAQWVKVMGANPSTFKTVQNCPNSFAQINVIDSCPNHPVDSVTWNAVQTYLTKLNQMNDGYFYRLPTEAEWEYAARAGSQTTFLFGNDPQLINGYAWYGANSDSQTQDVGQLSPNAWGLYDMVGNVWQWVQDYYAPYSALSVTDPVGPISSPDPKYPFREMRGGSWSSVVTSGLRVASRRGLTPELGDTGTGFRLVRTQK